jgi:hypothetical protein
MKKSELKNIIKEIIREESTAGDILSKISQSLSSYISEDPKMSYHPLHPKQKGWVVASILTNRFEDLNSVLRILIEEDFYIVSVRPLMNTQHEILVSE